MDLRIITNKELANLLGVSISTAKRYKKDIQNEYGLKRKPITQYHVREYFCIKTA